jgi:hypothetical protein
VGLVLLKHDFWGLFFSCKGKNVGEVTTASCWLELLSKSLLEFGGLSNVWKATSTEISNICTPKGPKGVKFTFFKVEVTIWNARILWGVLWCPLEEDDKARPSFAIASQKMTILLLSPLPCWHVHLWWNFGTMQRVVFVSSIEIKHLGLLSQKQKFEHVVCAQLLPKCLKSQKLDE